MSRPYDRLIDHCREQQLRQGKPDALVTLRVPGKPWGRRTSAKLPCGTLGHIVADDIEPGGRVRGVVAMYRADHLLRDLGYAGAGQEVAPGG